MEELSIRKSAYEIAYESSRKQLNEKFENERKIIQMIGDLSRKMIDRKEYDSLMELNKIMMAI